LACSEEAISQGRPSYVWRFGQDRRFALIRRHAPLDQAAVLDIGCGVGMYLRAFALHSHRVYGIDLNREHLAAAHEYSPNLAQARAESLPFRDGSFDVVLLHEVIEHVDDDAATTTEALRVTRPGGRVVVFAPNRLYPFETHGFYLGKRYVFKLAPLVNYLPGRLRRVFVPHVRAYLARDIRRLLPRGGCQIVAHSVIFPGYDRIAARHRLVARLLRGATYFMEHTPLRVFGLSHFVVIEKTREKAEEA